MSGCNFSIPFEGTPERLLTKARFAVESQGGTFTGDSLEGKFDVTAFGNTLVGSYTVDNQLMNIVITEKPFLFPCSAIESFLKSQINK